MDPASHAQKDDLKMISKYRRRRNPLHPGRIRNICYWRRRKNVLHVQENVLHKWLICNGRKSFSFCKGAAAVYFECFYIHFTCLSQQEFGK